MIIKEGYFVKKGFPKTNGKNIRDLLVDKVFGTPFLNTGDEFVFTHKDIGFDPFPKEVKDIIIVFKDGDNNEIELRFPEEYIGNRVVDESRRITVTIP